MKLAVTTAILAALSVAGCARTTNLIVTPQQGVTTGAPVINRAVVASGRPVMLLQLVSLNPDCTSLGQFDIRTTVPAVHGQSFARQVMAYSSFAAANPRSACNTRQSPTTILYYEAPAGYVGPDTFRADVISPQGVITTFDYQLQIR